MSIRLKVRLGTRFLTLALAALLGLCFGPGARAGLVLDVAADVGANVEFNGSGTGATFVFNNNGSGHGFDVTASSGVGDSIGLHGTIGGTYSYTTASIVTSGLLQTAPVSTGGGTLTLTDASLNSLTSTITGVDVATMGTGGAVNVSGAINLMNVSYTGTNADLMELRNEAQVGGGVVALTFQFVPGESLTQLAASGADHKTSYSGTITTSVPEPSSLAIGCIALGTIGIGLRWRKARGA
jgi:PEP-CTERM motif